MALQYTVWQDWVDRAGSESQLKRLAPEDTEVSHPRVEKAEAAAIKEMNSYLRVRGYKLPLESLTEDVKGHLMSLGMAWLTIRTQDLDKAVTHSANDARTFFHNVARGQATIEDTDTSTPDIPGKPIDVMFKNRPRDFDYDDPDSDASMKRPKL